LYITRIQVHTPEGKTVLNSKEMSNKQ
jgi:hypothetical protein